MQLHLPGMDSSRLTKEQLHALHRIVSQQLGFLVRLRLRMERRGFPSRDKLYLLVVDAEDKLQRLAIELHYAACSGVGRDSPRER